MVVAAKKMNSSTVDPQAMLTAFNFDGNMTLRGSDAVSQQKTSPEAFKAALKQEGHVN